MTSSERIQPHHLSRQAIAYVRQSTAQQAINNRESLDLQYALRHRVRALGWPDERKTKGVRVCRDKTGLE